jgi:peptide/nickel transport system ATP-binding protein
MSDFKPVPSASDPARPLVAVRDLCVSFGQGASRIAAVNGISFEVGVGEVLGLIGESGCGKSVTMRALMRLHPPAKTTLSGQMQVDGQDLQSLSGQALRRYRGGTAAMIFQDPGLALDPVFTIGQQIEEAVRWHTACSRTEARARALELLSMVKIPSPAERLGNYPHEMSGGMRQRAMIALAIACHPKLLLADEPTTALDATVQIQVLLIFRELQQRLGMSAIFVTHDLGVAAEICDRVAVMYAGRIVEIGTVSQILKHPQHPYTQALLASTLHGNMRGTRIQGIGGAPPNLADLPAGCAFRPRCPRAQDRCAQSVPLLTPAGQGQQAACFVVADTLRTYRLALLNPNTSAAATALMLTSARQALPADAHIEGYTAPSGQAFITTPEALDEAARMMDKFALSVSGADVDGLIVSGFGDPGLESIRRQLKMPVTGLAEAGIAEAASGGRRFSIVTVTPALLSSLTQAAQRHGGAGQLASIRFTGGAVGDALDTPENLEAALLQACRLAISEDGAQSIVIGGGPLAQAASAISRQLGVEVIDPVAAAVRLSYRRCKEGPLSAALS